ncbi:TraB/GumN family protein [Evansella sp. AB-rgal1]|uniref:TraB/GumN family protein n=1 Tax=Evansella sp. AB-rgal1 TaxID=3242696 RepID=UPI00359EF5F3
MQKFVTFVMFVLLMFTAACEQGGNAHGGKNEGSPGNSSNDSSNDVQPDTPLNNSQGFLWKITEENNTVYLLGSIHAGNDALYPIRQEIIDAFEQSDYIVFEIDVTEPFSDEYFEQFQEVTRFPESTSLLDTLPHELYEKLDTALDKYEELLLQYGWRKDDIDEYKPWFLWMVLEEMHFAYLDYDYDFGIESFFLDNLRDNMGILGLELTLSRYRALNNFSLDVQTYLLEKTVDSILEEKDDLAGLLEIWRAGDLVSLENYAANVTTSRESSEFYSVMLEERNISMTDQIDQLLQDQSGNTYFIVVGALHFVGDSAISKLLTEKGYEVVRY